MTENNFRHHHAGRDRIIFVPIEIGSPKSVRGVKPGPYPQQGRQPWRPATRPPSKAERSVQLLRRICEQESDVYEYMRRAREGASHAG
jgi:hypothetical protein